MVDLRISAQDLQKTLGNISRMEGEARTAVRAALRRTGQSMRTDVVRQVEEESFILGSVIRKATRSRVREGHDSTETTVTVAGRRRAMDDYGLYPEAVTARKGMRSAYWGSPGYKVGPNEPVRTAFGAFVIRKNNRLLMLRRSGRKLYRVYGYAPQYFAAFDGVSDRVLDKGHETFLKRLKHEIAWRTGARS